MTHLVVESKALCVGSEILSLAQDPFYTLLKLLNLHLSKWLPGCQQNGLMCHRVYYNPDPDLPSLCNSLFKGLSWYMLFSCKTSHLSGMSDLYVNCTLKYQTIVHCVFTNGLHLLSSSIMLLEILCISLILTRKNYHPKCDLLVNITLRGGRESEFWVGKQF